MKASEMYRKLLGNRKENPCKSIGDFYIEKSKKQLEMFYFIVKRQELGGNKGIHSLEENEQ